MKDKEEEEFHPALGLMCSICNTAVALMFAPNLETKNMVREFLFKNGVYVLCTDCARVPKYTNDELERRYKGGN